MVIKEPVDIREKRYTAEEFWEIASRPENAEKRLELDDGVIVEIAGSKPENTITAVNIATDLNLFVRKHNLGYVSGADGEFKLAPRIVREPDVAFIARHKITGKKFPKRFEFAPDLAVEVVSAREDVLKKAQEYLMYGGRMVWAVYFDDKLVYVFKPAASNKLDVQVFGIEDTLDGGEVLPGFTLKVKDIFPE